MAFCSKGLLQQLESALQCTLGRLLHSWALIKLHFQKVVAVHTSFITAHFMMRYNYCRWSSDDKRWVVNLREWGWMVGWDNLRMQNNCNEKIEKYFCLLSLYEWNRIDWLLEKNWLKTWERSFRVFSNNKMKY